MIQIDWHDIIGLVGCLLVIGGLAWWFPPAALVALGAVLLVVYYLKESRSAAQSPAPTAPASNEPDEG